MPYRHTCTCICCCRQAEKSRDRLDLVTFSVDSAKDLRAMRKALGSVTEYFEVGLSIVAQLVSFLTQECFFLARCSSRLRSIGSLMVMQGAVRRGLQGHTFLVAGGWRLTPRMPLPRPTALAPCLQ